MWLEQANLKHDARTSHRTQLMSEPNYLGELLMFLAVTAMQPIWRQQVTGPKYITSKDEEHKEESENKNNSRARSPKSHGKSN